MITKSRILGLLAILVVGFFMFRPGNEPTDSDNRSRGSESATDRQLQPREPAFLTPDREYGLAARRGAARAPAPYDRSDAYGHGPGHAPYSEGDRSTDGYGRQPPIATGGYRFRPLSEREQARLRERRPGRYANEYTASYGPSGTQQAPSPWTEPRAATPAPYSLPPRYSAPEEESYSFRPLERSPAVRNRWQGPYGEPGGRFDRYPMDPWTAPPPPQWGATPAQRMYPSFYRDSGRRLSAR